jgi:hypothetical protein
MKCRDGKMPRYKVQTEVDAKHHMIAMAVVIIDECDINLLKPDLKNLTEQLGFTPKEIEEDRRRGVSKSFLFALSDDIHHYESVF